LSEYIRFEVTALRDRFSPVLVAFFPMDEDFFLLRIIIANSVATMSTIIIAVTITTNIGNAGVF
jgi:hypothetical protein